MLHWRSEREEKELFPRNTQKLEINNMPLTEMSCILSVAYRPATSKYMHAEQTVMFSGTRVTLVHTCSCSYTLRRNLQYWCELQKVPFTRIYKAANISTAIVKANYAHTVPITEVKNWSAERIPLVLKKTKTFQYVWSWENCSIK